VSLRLGVLWQATPDFSVGANYKSRTEMGKLDGYETDLLAYSAGKLDVPEQYGIGVSWKPVPQVTLAADWMTIRWGGVLAMQDPNGFNWQDQPVVRVGVSWDVNPTWTVRAGVSTNQRQIKTAYIAQNLLAPSIHENAYSAGATFKLDSKSDISAGFEMNPETTMNGTAASAGTSLTSKVVIFMLGYTRSF
jgi:long-chain fatty acid transport protein